MRLSIDLHATFNTSERSVSLSKDSNDGVMHLPTVK